MTFIDVLQGIYYLSGIALAFGVFLAARQLKQSKRESKTNAKRESFKLTIEQCSFFTKDIIPEINNFHEKIKREKIKSYDILKLNSSEKGIEIMQKNTPEIHNIINEFNKKQPLVKEGISIMNKLELFALPFIMKIADESSAYTTNNRVYCETIEKLSILLSTIGMLNKKEPIIKLYHLWKMRQNKESLNKESNKLLKEKQVIDKKIKLLKESKISPIGRQ